MSKTKRNFQKNRKTRKNKTLKQSGGMNLNMIIYTLMMLGLIFPISAKVFGIEENIKETTLQNMGNVIANSFLVSPDSPVGLKAVRTYYFPKIAGLAKAISLISPRSRDIQKETEILNEMISNEDIIFFKYQDLRRFFNMYFEMGSNKPLIKDVDFKNEILGNDIYWGIHKDLLEKLLEYLRKPIVDKTMLKFLLKNTNIDPEL
jgi:hypothetical protein